MTDMNAIVGGHDILLVTLDTLRYDVAARLAASGETPVLTALLPGGRWERRHTPGSFTYAAHAAMLAGFLPTPASPGPHPRLFAGRFPGSETTADGTWTYDAADLPSGLAKAGYHTACVGGVGFFNKRTPLGSVLPGLFAESHWEPEFGVTDPSSLENQIARVAEILERLPPDRRLFLLLNVAALHQPNWFYLNDVPAAQARRGAPRETAGPESASSEGDSLESHAAALRYVDRQLGRLFDLMRRPCFVIVCSDHGTAYGEDGHIGHRIGHEVVWTVPYGEFVLK
ncbi:MULTISPECIES: STM4013/SEN3800 family hydrolase [Actinomadura]|uniref:STM4013/SEN3800 family hydrolase n=1 Tax=Actinomadura yumaensis TaxID=111807 RepID=A0ABW2CRR5_9ACTN|nr:STM4013/SEN3800 family hydrolase [Actinomadura sp. J1-007]MWK37563.1 sulfatase-like hydrolase/transferase [Actinomadura sp. J1-007]